MLMFVSEKFQSDSMPYGVKILALSIGVKQ